ncbi:MAG: hypothetical protein M1828_003355 [Chrysothrix sp. TS-e1954]|nr:MAG: hypothetical protein M1828_003355 [Chrysothrix sp. TS-e1954]
MATEDEEEDYMSMALLDSKSQSSAETSLQRRARKEREGQEKGRVKSKAQKEAEEAAAREAALGTSLDRSNKGFKMMEKLGFKGGALGKEGYSEGLTNPLNPIVKEGRSGIGLDSERKREAREQLEGQAKKAKATEDEYRDHMRREAEVKRLEGQIVGAQKVAERLDDNDESVTNGAKRDGPGNEDDEKSIDDASPDASLAVMSKTSQKKGHDSSSKPLRSINVLWRGRAKYQREKERERRIRHDLQKSLSGLPTYTDAEEDKDDRLAFAREEEEVEEDDPELEEYNALEPEERLTRLVEYLRQRRQYCFWCKYQYPDAELEGCPGLTEDEHG